MTTLKGRDALPSRGRWPDIGRIIGPHGIALLLAAAFLFSVIPGRETHTGIHAGTPECAILQDFLGDPALRAAFQRTPAEIQRWENAYERDCR